MARSLEELRDYLVGEWLLDNNFKDTSGNGNDGTPVDIEWKPTVRGLKPYFNGSSSCLKVPYTQDLLDFGSNDFSIFTYAKINGKPGSSNGVVISTSNDYWDENWVGIYTDSDLSNYIYGCRKNGTFYIKDSNYIPPIGKFVHIGIVKSGTTISFYSNGMLDGHVTVPETIISSNEGLHLMGNGNLRYLIGNTDQTLIYKNTALTDDEVLALYESTKHAYGVRPAERSFTHRLQPEVDDNTVFATDMSTKNSDGTLMDLSGNSNHGDIQGAVRAGGYFTDGMMFDGVDDYIDLGGATLGNEYFGIEMILTPKILTDGVFHDFISQYLSGYSGRFHYSTFNNFFAWRLGEVNGSFECTKDEKLTHIIIQRKQNILNVYINAVLTDSNNSIVDDTHQLTNTKIGGSLSSPYGELLYCRILDTPFETQSQIKSRFNSLATLPLYTFNASKYPTSSGWTSNVPYSSMIISSGEFSFTDAGQLQCDSAGSFTLRNAHEFDGDEYIKVVIDGVEYSHANQVIPLNNIYQSCDSLGGWYLNIGSNSITHNNDLYIAGTSAINVIKNDTTLDELYISKDIDATDFSTKSIAVQVYILNESVIEKLQSDGNGAFQIFLFSGDSWVMDMYPKYELRVGWNQIIMKCDNTEYTNGTPDLSTIDKIRFDVNTQDQSTQIEEGEIIMDAWYISDTHISVTQGSTLIDVDMGTGDVIDGIDIQFREPVE
jgi:hypothetical protein